MLPLYASNLRYTKPANPFMSASNARLSPEVVDMMIVAARRQERRREQMAAQRAAEIAESDALLDGTVTP